MWVTVLIDIITAKKQTIDISVQGTQTLNVSNAVEQNIDISSHPNQEVDILNSVPDQYIEVFPLWTSQAHIAELVLEVNGKVPKELNILPQVLNSQISTVPLREASRVYLQVGDVPSFATLEQIKELNTKTIFVDKLTDSKVYQLSNEDIIMLRKE